jgi:hypothetical protein
VRSSLLSVGGSKSGLHDSEYFAQQGSDRENRSSDWTVLSKLQPKFNDIYLKDTIVFVVKDRSTVLLQKGQD